MVIILVSALLYFSFAGIVHLDVKNFENFFQKGIGNLAVGIALLTFTYLGSNGIIELGGEIKDAGKAIPRAYFITFPIVAIVYLLVAIAALVLFHGIQHPGWEPSIHKQINIKQCRVHVFYPGWCSACPYHNAQCSVYCRH